MDEIIINKNENYSWTKINGFWFHYGLNTPNNNAIVIRSGVKLDEYSKNKFDSFLAKFQTNGFILGYKNLNEKYMVVVPPDYDDDKIKKLLSAFSNALYQLNAEPACDSCGKITKAGFIFSKNMPIVVCHSCQEQIMESETKNYNNPSDDGKKKTQDVEDGSAKQNHTQQVDDKQLDDEQIENGQISFTIKKDENQANKYIKKDDNNDDLQTTEDTVKSRFGFRTKKKENNKNDKINKANIPTKDKPQRYILGFILAIFFALFASIFWILIGQSEFIIIIKYFTSTLIMLGAILGFDFGNGKKNTFSAIVLILISLLVLFFAEFISLGFTYYGLSPIPNNLHDILMVYLNMFVKSPTYLSIFIKDYVLGVVVMFIIAFWRLSDFFEDD